LVKQADSLTVCITKCLSRGLQQGDPDSPDIAFLVPGVGGYPPVCDAITISVFRI